MSVLVVNEGAARRITEHICILLDSVAGQMDRLAQAVQEAYSKRVDQVLGYDSWAEYASKEFGPHTQSLAAPIRRELVAKLTDTGLSTRAQAPVLGVSKQTITNYQHEVPKKLATELSDPSDYSVAAPDYEDDARLSPIVSVEHHDVSESVDPDTGEIVADAEPKKVTGLDGKQYSAPERQVMKPRRQPITERFTSRTVDLIKLVESFTRLIEDDRFDTNKQNIADANASDIKRGIDALSKVFDALNDK